MFKKIDISLEELKSLLKYDENTGVFTWIKNNKIAGTVDKKSKSRSYIKIGINGSCYKAHRIAWYYFYGKESTLQLDHKDHNGLNNKINNLREVTNQENLRNTNIFNTNTSGVLGVRLNKKSNKWNAQITVNGKNIWLGSFLTKEDALIIRKKAEIKYGFHENHGKII